MDIHTEVILRIECFVAGYEYGKTMKQNLQKDKVLQLLHSTLAILKISKNKTEEIKECINSLNITGIEI
jgi:flagellar biosynthesis regulator FlaF